MVKSGGTLPESLRQEVERVAEQLVQEKYLEARKIAAIETASKLLRKALQLIEFGAPEKPVKQNVSPSSKPAILHPCVNCGHEGKYQPKPSQWNKNPGWLCEVHGQAYAADNATIHFNKLPQAEPIEE